jgi:hypothetical protein
MNVAALHYLLGVGAGRTPKPSISILLSIGSVEMGTSTDGA